MDSVLVTYLVDGTTRHKTIIGERVSVQLRKRGTFISVAGADPGDVTEVHIFRHAEYVKWIKKEDHHGEKGSERRLRSVGAGGGQPQGPGGRQTHR